MFRRFGSQVSIVARLPHLIAREDEDVSETLRDILQSEGIGVHTRAERIVSNMSP